MKNASPNVAVHQLIECHNIGKYKCIFKLVNGKIIFNVNRQRF